MPDYTFTDNVTPTAAEWNTNVRDQVISTCTSGARPTAIEGRRIYETDTDRSYEYNGTSWILVGSLGAWVSYTPTLAVWAQGNGTLSSAYSRMGSTCHVRIQLTAGSTTTFGTSPTFTLPFTAASGSAGMIHSAARLSDATGSDYLALVTFASTTTLEPKIINAASTYATTANITSTAPFTWTTSDVVRIQFTYEVAP